MYKELEYKYRANDVGLTEFQQVMNKLLIHRTLDVSSWDVYYVKGEDEFIRFRNGSNPELTIKRKTQQGNNWDRIEIDLPMDKGRLNKETVDRFVGLLGYKENFKIYKSCFIYWLAHVNYVYYIVYDENLKEKDRFIEVEVNKGFEYVPDALDDGAKALTTLGIGPKNRLKKSLFELFKKD